MCKMVIIIFAMQGWCEDIKEKNYTKHPAQYIVGTNFILDRTLI